jgi:hypothetical protein
VQNSDAKNFSQRMYNAFITNYNTIINRYKDLFQNYRFWKDDLLRNSRNITLYKNAQHYYTVIIKEPTTFLQKSIMSLSKPTQLTPYSEVESSIPHDYKIIDVTKKQLEGDITDIYTIVEGYKRDISINHIYSEWVAMDKLMEMSKNANI